MIKQNIFKLKLLSNNPHKIISNPQWGNPNMEIIPVETQLKCH